MATRPWIKAATKNFNRRNHETIDEQKSSKQQRQCLSICLAKKRKREKKTDSKHNNETESVGVPNWYVYTYFVRICCTFTVSLIQDIALLRPGRFHFRRYWLVGTFLSTQSEPFPKKKQRRLTLSSHLTGKEHRRSHVPTWAVRSPNPSPLDNQPSPPPQSIIAHASARSFPACHC